MTLIKERDRLVLLQREIFRFKDQKVNLPPRGLLGVTISGLDRLLGGREMRIACYQWLFDDPFILHTSDLQDWQKFSLVYWAKPAKLTEDSPWTYDRQFRDDCFILKSVLRRLQEHAQNST